MTAVDRAIARFKSQLGYHETGKNITKYAQDFDTKWPNFYNTKKQGAEWCDMSYDWCFVTEFGEDIGRQMLYQPWHSAGAGCKFSAGYYKNANAFYKSNPQRGDQIFFYVGGEINHTGMVIEVNGDTITTIEGNCGDAVRQNSYKLNNSKIAGYGRPNWSLVDKEVQTVDISMPVLQKGSQCAEVGTVQVLLNQLGYRGSNGRSLVVDHVYGSNCEYAVKNFQKACGMNSDGICGQKTWNALLKANY